MEKKIRVLHADSLAGPFQQLSAAFGTKDFAIEFISGRSKELAEQIQLGEPCDLLVTSDPFVIESRMPDLAAWYAVFSANEMVVIMKKGLFPEAKRLTDLFDKEVRLALVTGKKDLATGRTVEFLNRVATLEHSEESLQAILKHSTVGVQTIPEVVEAVRGGLSDIGVVYRSAAVAAGREVDILSFPPSVNLSEQIRNALTIPVAASSPLEAAQFVNYILSAEGCEILKKAGQPAISPPRWRGNIPSTLIYS